MTIVTRLPSRVIRTCIRSVRKWFGNYLYFSKATICIRGLVFSHSFVNHAIVSILITYLTYNWVTPRFQIAAVIMNVLEGVSAIMIIVLAHISDTYICSFQMIASTSAFYILGLVLFSISAKLKNVDVAAKVFYGAAPLVALGEAGRSAALNKFLDDQYLSEQEQINCTNEKRVESRKDALWSHPWFLGAAAPLLLLNTSWSVRFMISTIGMGVFYILFWFGLFFYSINKKNSMAMAIEQDTSSPVEEAQRVETSITNRGVRKPLSSKTSRKREKFWMVRKLKEEKRLFKDMLIMWLALLVCSLVEATGTTFFFEQISNLDDHIGSNFRVPTVYFTVLKSFSSYTISYLWWLLIPKRMRQRATLVRIGCGMVCCVLCCVAAWQVEIHRLYKIKREGLEDDTSTISMSILWLVPQFSLLGLMRGLAIDGLIDFFVDRVADDDKVMARYYGSYANEFVVGIGKLITALSILVFRESWFDDNINRSRLDKYYRALTFIGLANFCYYLCLAFYFYVKDKSQEPAIEEDKENTMEDLKIDDDDDGDGDDGYDNHEVSLGGVDFQDEQWEMQGKIVDCCCYFYCC